MKPEKLKEVKHSYHQGTFFIILKLIKQSFFAEATKKLFGNENMKGTGSHMEGILGYLRKRMTQKHSSFPNVTGGNSYRWGQPKPSDEPHPLIQILIAVPCDVTCKTIGNVHKIFNLKHVKKLYFQKVETCLQCPIRIGGYPSSKAIG